MYDNFQNVIYLLISVNFWTDGLMFSSYSLFPFHFLYLFIYFLTTPFHFYINQASGSPIYNTSMFALVGARVIEVSINFGV